ncbi:myosin head family protein [Cryptosporidium muris RN66]|uniref:Myosin head family protein n=1 Tax=Cryptosporidium muris (strain RN66) TaxID=441375 RepID=B6AF07_CRYMR|nr:myosin head family protein [Cryptosporidium muris RN66]EEA06774.1 myosin head family protein [Cryptosporidium muris RN66]|eukprot:XP_002141123.1 myosin head family protein [Cryptosporidium muris RN66]
MNVITSDIPPNGGSKPKDLGLKRKYSMVKADNLLINNYIWVQSPNKNITHRYLVGTVVGFSGNKICVKLEEGEVEVENSLCFNYNVGVDPYQINDLTKLAHTNEASVLYILNERFKKDLIYSYVGRLLIAVNPFKMISGLYGKENIQKYKKADYRFGLPSNLPPHTFAIAQKSLQLLESQKSNQSCIVTGESGAGKTETARQLMNYYALVGENINNKVQDVILGANPLLEALGNSKTLRNNNSSRFGRFIKLCIDNSKGITGGCISSYMLELSRIGHQIENERSYHIFYQILKYYKLEPNISKFKFREISWYKYLNSSKCYDVDTIDDVKEFSLNVYPQMERILSKKEDIEELICLYSGILLVGNIEFDEHEAMGTDNAAYIKSHDIFDDISTLWGVDKKTFEELILTNSIDIRGTKVTSALTPTRALEQIESCAKEIYLKCFEYLIKLINIAIQFDESKNFWIGILDIYGFEVFKINGFEQFLINFANEKLQQFFVLSVFETELKEYEDELIVHDDIKYEDNASLVHLFDGKGGLFDLLEEACLLANSTYENFTNSCHKMCKNKTGYLLPKGSVEDKFIIEHTAKTVEYTTKEFVIKNKHRLRPEIIELFKQSKNNIIKKSFENVEIINSNKLKGKFVANIFKISIDELLNILHSTSAQFIRCIKPNEKKVADLIEPDMVVDQLQSLSIMEAILLLQKGYAYRETFENFIKENMIIMKLLGQNIYNESSDPKEQCIKAMKSMKIPEKEWQIGKTKIFIKKDGWLAVERYFRSSIKKLLPIVECLVSIYRITTVREKMLNRVSMLIRCQSLAKTYIKTRFLIQRNKLVKTFIGIVLLMNTSKIVIRCEKAALKIQKVYRGYKVRASVNNELKKKIAGKKIYKLIRSLVIALRIKKKWMNVIIAIRSNRAASRLQKAWRRYRINKFIKELKKNVIQQVKALKIQSCWRYYYLRKIMLHYIKIAVPARKIQSLWRGYWVRKYMVHAAEFDKIRDKLRKVHYIIIIQSMIRRYWILAHLEQLYWSADFLQPIIHSKLTRVYWKKLKNSVICIQSWWKGDRVRQIIREERLNVLLMSERVRTQYLTRCECRNVLAWDIERRNMNRIIIGSSKEKPPQEGLQVIQIVVDVDISREYPVGWMEGLKGLNFSENYIKDIAIGGFHTVVLTGSGKVYTFGMNDKGQLGVGKNSIELLGRAIIRLNNPLQLTKIKSISSGIDHCIALSTSGMIYCWGANDYGQCGSNVNNTYLISPTIITLPSNSKNTIFTFAEAGGFHCVAITSENKILVWGRGFDLGLEGVNGSIFTPMQLNSPNLQKLGNINSLHCGLATTFLLGVNGYIAVFGRSTYGILGLGRGVYSTKRPKIITSICRVIDLSVGYNFVLAVTTDGNVYQWGQIPVWNPLLERPVPTNFYTPQFVKLNSNNNPVLQVQAGWWHSVIRMKNNLLLSWTFLENNSEVLYKNSNKQAKMKNISENVIKPVIFKLELAEGRCTKTIHVVSSPSITVVLRSGPDHYNKDIIGTKVYHKYLIKQGYTGTEIPLQSKLKYDSVDELSDDLEIYKDKSTNESWEIFNKSCKLLDIFESSPYPALKNRQVPFIIDDNSSAKALNKAKINLINVHTSVKSSAIGSKNIQLNGSR